MAWGVVVSAYYSHPEVCEAMPFLAMVSDLDAAVQAWISHGYSLDTELTRYGNRQLRALNPPREYVEEARRERRPSPKSISVILDREWNYDVKRHFELYPDTFWPPLAAFLNATITLTLDRDVSHLPRYQWDDDCYHLADMIAYLYEPLAPGVRDLTDELSLPNRQYHIDRCYGTWSSSMMDDIQGHICEVHRQIRDGKRSVRDPVAEYEACAMEHGLALENEEYRPLAPEQRQTKYYGILNRSRRYHISNSPPDNIVEVMRAVREKLHSKVPARESGAYADWAKSAGLRSSVEKEDEYWWRDPGIFNRARRIRQQIVPTTHCAWRVGADLAI